MGVQRSSTTGGRAATVQSKTANYVATSGDLVLMDASGGNRTVTLPAVASGAVCTAKKTDSSANTVTVSPASGTIDGAASKVISTQYESYDFVSDGTNWFIV